MRITSMAQMNYRMYAFGKKYGLSSSSSSFDFSKIKNVDAYAKNLFETSGVASKLTHKVNDSASASKPDTDTGEKPFKADGSQANEGYVPSISLQTDAGKAAGTDQTSDISATKGTEKTNASSSVENAFSAQTSDAAQAGNVTANERKNTLNAYTSYMQSALASSGLDQLV